MKAISIWQPWASLIAAGGKEYETRSWKTSYRGPLAICSSKNSPMWAIRAAYNEEEIYQFAFDNQLLDHNKLPKGCVVAVCELVDCIEITPEFTQTLSDLEYIAGDYTPGRFAWKLAKVRRLNTPKPVKGSQGFFTVDGVCRVCGCIDTDCSGCFDRTGEPCYWVEPDLCSACAKPAIHRIHQLLSRHRFDVSEEKSLQEQLGDVFKLNGIDFKREVQLSAHDRIDFLVGDIGIEVKIKGSPSAIYQQCRRYCALEQVKELLLITGRSMGLPGEIEGKPCYLHNLGLSWL